MKKGMMTLATVLLGFFVAITGCKGDGAGEKPPTELEDGGNTRTVFYVDANASDVDADGSEEKPFPTIHEAVEVAPAGSTIRIRPGRYYESNVQLKEGMVVEGDPPLEAEVCEGMPGLSILKLADRVRVEGLKFCSEFSLYLSEVGDALYFEPNHTTDPPIHFTIRNNVFSTAYVQITYASGEISNNVFKDGSALYFGIAPGEEARIFQNTFQGIHYIRPDYPMLCASLGQTSENPEEDSHIIYFHDNTIENCGKGVSITAVTHIKFEKNIVRDNAVQGIEIFSCGDNTRGKIDLGGGAYGSVGQNIIQNNGWDKDNEFLSGYNFYDFTYYKACNDVTQFPIISARYNIWDHDTVKDVDRYDVYDDDEDPQFPAVELSPLGTSSEASSLASYPAPPSRIRTISLRYRMHYYPILSGRTSWGFHKNVSSLPFVSEFFSFPWEKMFGDRPVRHNGSWVPIIMAGINHRHG